MKSRQELMQDIQILDFAIQEAALFLNAHPDNEEAMQYYQKHREYKDKATAIYERCYGALSNRSNLNSTWEYVNGPWPWSGVHNTCAIFKNDSNFR